MMRPSLVDTTQSPFDTQVPSEISADDTTLARAVGSESMGMETTARLVALTTAVVGSVQVQASMNGGIRPVPPQIGQTVGGSGVGSMVVMVGFLLRSGSGDGGGVR